MFKTGTIDYCMKTTWPSPESPLTVRMDFRDRLCEFLMLDCEMGFEFPFRRHPKGVGFFLQELTAVLRSTVQLKICKIGRGNGKLITKANSGQSPVFFRAESPEV